MRKTIFTSLLLAAAIAVSLAPVSNAFAGVSDIYFSFSGFGDGGAAGNNTRMMTVGETGSAFIWVDDTYQIDTGAFLDITNNNTGVIAFTGAEVFNPDIVVGGDTVVDSRWQSFAGGTVSNGFIDEMNGFRVTEGTGILPGQATGNVFEDTLHDPTSNAFLFARVDFSVVGQGNADLSMESGFGLIVDGGIELFPNFGDATVIGIAVPEPASVGLLTLGLIGLVVRRRR